MATGGQLHPTHLQLHAFAQGRLSTDERTAIELHVRDCDVCCRSLAHLPKDDRLEKLARDVHGRAADTSEPALCDTRVMSCDDNSEGSERQIVSRLGSTSQESHPELVPPELESHPRYRIIRLLGRGGMGVVWLAEHQMMQRLVALKVISSRLTSGREAVERFRQEVRTAARLTHPNIVNAFDAEQAGDLHILVTEYVDGRSLDQWVHQSGVLTVAQACSAIRQVCYGLQHAHDHGMIHRDIKPENLMQAKNGTVKILDFGLARLEQQAAKVSQTAKTEMNLTAVGMVLGTPDYMAPEQAVDPSSADARSDIYSLGCTLFFVLAGRAPFESGSFMEMMSSGMQRPMTALNSLRADLSPNLNRLIARMTAQRPEDRFRSAAEVADALTPFCQDEKQTLIRSAVSFEPSNSRVASSRPSEQQPPASRRLSPVRVRPRSGIAPKSRQLPGTMHPLAAQFSRLRGLFRQSRTRTLFIAAGLLLTAVLFAFLPPDAADDSVIVTAQLPETVAPLNKTKAPIVSGTPLRVLLVVPATEFWWGDVSPIILSLKAANVEWTMTSWVNPAVSIHETDAPVQVGVLLHDVQASDYDAVILGGGRGLWKLTEDSTESRDAERIIRQMLADGKIVSAFSAGPGVLAKMGLLNGVTATGHEWIREDVRTRFQISLTDSEVEHSGQIITGRDADTIPQFTAELLRSLNQSP